MFPDSIWEHQMKTLYIEAVRNLPYTGENKPLMRKVLRVFFEGQNIQCLLKLWNSIVNFNYVLLCI